MKTGQQQKAREMYFQSDLSKSEIADKLGVNRRTIYQWSVDGDWEKLRTSARNMPSILAEKCYYLIGHFTDHLLSKESFYQSVTKADVDILFKLTKTINLLKKGSTVNEDMETFTFFLESLQAKDADLADAVAPHVDTFITGRSANASISATINGITPQGFKPFPEKEIMEKWQDEQDAAALAAEGWVPYTTDQNRDDTPATGTPPQHHCSTTAIPSYTETQTAAPLQFEPAIPLNLLEINTIEEIDNSFKNYKQAYWKSQDRAKLHKQEAKSKKSTR